MKLYGRPGEFYFKSLQKSISGKTGLMLSPNYYKSEQEAADDFPGHVSIWPAEEISPGVIYVPSEEELKEDQA